MLRNPKVNIITDDGRRWLSHGEKQFDPEKLSDRALLDSLTSLEQGSQHLIEGCPEVLARTAGRVRITDDNMGTEWRHYLGLE